MYIIDYFDIVQKEDERVFSYGDIRDIRQQKRFFFSGMATKKKTNKNVYAHIYSTRDARNFSILTSLAILQ